MEKLPEEVTSAVRSFAENERRAMPGEHPPAEDLLAYHEGRLTRVGHDELRRHLVLCSECTRLLIDLKEFGQLEPPEESQRLSDDDVAAQKEDLKARLAEEDDLVATTAVLPFERPRPSVPSAYWAALAALVVVALGLGLRGWRQPGTGGTPEVFYLYPETFRSSEAKALRIPAWADSYVLAFGSVPSQRHSTFRIEIRDAAGELVLADETLRTSYDRTIKRALPWNRLPEGVYEVRLLGLGRGPPELRATYTFQLVFETGR